MKYAIIQWDRLSMVDTGPGEVIGWYSSLAEAMLRCLEHVSRNPNCHAVIVKMV